MSTESGRTPLRASSRKCQVSPTLIQGLTLHFHYKRVPKSDNYRNVVVGASAPLAHWSGRRGACPTKILRRQDVLRARNIFELVCSIHCASYICSYNRRHEEDHFHERSARCDRSVLASGAQRKFAVLQRSNSARPEVRPNRFRRYHRADASSVGQYRSPFASRGT